MLPRVTGELRGGFGMNVVEHPAANADRARGWREGTYVVDEKTLEVIGVNGDISSPLHQIREKEIEISGRVLAAKQKAEALVADARRESAETINKARAEGDALAREREAGLVAEAEEQAKALRGGVGVDVKAIEKQVAERSTAAVSAVVRMVAEV